VRFHRVKAARQYANSNPTELFLQEMTSHLRAGGDQARVIAVNSMPRIAILSDIHSNLHALEAVLEDAAACGVDGLAFGGDTVGYGAFPGACVDRVMATGAPCVLGNHDHYVGRLESQLDILETDPEVTNNPVWMGIAHSIRETTGTPRMDWLRDLPMLLRLPGAILAHAALHDMEDWPYITDAGVATRTLALLDEPIGFFGHSHLTRLFFDKSRPARPRWVDRTRIQIPSDGRCALTVGSVGQPRDGDTNASWVIWDSDALIVELKRTPYPQIEAARAILETGLPAHSARRLLPTATPLPSWK
jgi:diadenosine tetraphosphatase ApaH/serine/threonine PP2A family protein phosphatase